MKTRKVSANESMNQKPCGCNDFEYCETHKQITTPTPWFADLSTIYGDYTVDDNEIVGTVINKADAAFIVRAVNSYESLRSSNEELLAALKTTRDNIISLKAAKYPETFTYYDKWLEVVETALFKGGNNNGQTKKCEI